MSASVQAPWAASGHAAGHRVVLRQSGWDAALVVLALAHGLLLIWRPTAVVIALGLWWNSNTISHWFLHQPFFQAAWLNRLFSCYLSVLLGVPQTLWRQRHLAHHAQTRWRWRSNPQLLVETALVLTLWTALLAWRPAFFLAVYMPGIAIGLFLCWLHGHYEHVRGTVSHYGRLYNLLFFNDGYHAEHHDCPGRHWSRLKSHRRRHATVSSLPAVLRWAEVFTLEGLERLVLRFALLRRFVVWVHQRAIQRLLPAIGEFQTVGVVGGGLFPRTALIFNRLAPNAELTIVDVSRGNLNTARPLLDGNVKTINALYDPVRHGGFDLLVIPLAYVGDRGRFYRDPPAPVVLIHDWLWKWKPQGVVVSVLLLKRLNLVKR